MEKKGDKLVNIKGAEGIVIHNGNVVLGMQKPKRWYELDNNKMATIIKTLGGEIEETDKEDSKKTIIREIMEEVDDINEKDIKISKTPIFTKSITMGKLNPYERDSKLNMLADFYLLEIIKEGKLFPNDLPALIEIQVDFFLNIEFSKQYSMSNLKRWITKNKKNDIVIPDYYALMIPEEVKKFLNEIKKYIKCEGEIER